MENKNLSIIKYIYQFLLNFAIILTVYKIFDINKYVENINPDWLISPLILLVLSFLLILAFKNIKIDKLVSRIYYIGGTLLLIYFLLLSILFTSYMPNYDKKIKENQVEIK